jgi:hypothetical protein
MPSSSTNSLSPQITARRPKKKNKPRRSVIASLLLFGLFCLLFLSAVLIASFFTPQKKAHLFHFVSPTFLAAPDIQQAAAPLPPLPGLANPQTSVVEMRIHPDRVPMILIAGGIAGTRRGAHREGVSEFVQACGAAAGLNGTFFANASLTGTDNLLIGPSLCGNETQVVKGPFDHRSELAGRPLVLISPTRTRLVAYDPATMDSNAQIRQLLPGVTDVFLGGVWMVHEGKAADRQRIERFKVLDANDPRVRAFFGLMKDGRPVLGATTWVVSSVHLAKALQDAGLQEAVLLDSGFSTSLVWKDRILVTGHTSPGIPSRPVPHALLLFSKSEMAKTQSVSPPAA